MTVANPTLTTTKTYDGNTSAVVTAGGLQNVVNSENVTVSAIANYDTKDQGSNKVITVVYTISGTDIANYIKPVDFTTGGVISKLQLTVANPTLTTTKTYDGNTSAVVTAGGLQNVVNSENVTVSAIANYDTKDQGSNKVITVVYTISGTDIANYIKPVDFTTGGVISKLQLTVANPTLTTTKTYDGNTSAVVTAGGLQNVVNSENVTVSAIANYDTKDQGSNKVITVVYTISGTDIANYIKPVDFTTGGVISKLQLTVANPTLTTTKTYDGNTSAVVTAGGLQNVVNSENVTVSAIANYDTKDRVQIR